MSCLTEVSLSQKQISDFREKGFLLIDNLVSLDLVTKLRERIELIFNGEFDTGIYPDEWHWRKGLSLPDVTREICNAWKSDKLIASVVLSSTIGQICSQLSSWNGARVAQDDVWYKPPGRGKEIAFHQDSPYISAQFIPFENNSVTCWLALDDVSQVNGTLAYVAGSHKWPPFDSKEFHAPENNWKSPLLLAYDHAKKVYNFTDESPPIQYVNLNAGGCAFHHQLTWHGSGQNTSAQPRRSIGIHLINKDVKFVEQPTYIYGRYKLSNSCSLQEDFFPIISSNDGYTSPKPFFLR